jgi:hypothetical protein
LSSLRLSAPQALRSRGFHAFRQAEDRRFRERQRNQRIPGVGRRLSRRSDPPAAKPELLPRKNGRGMARERSVPGPGKIQISRLTGRRPEIRASFNVNQKSRDIKV